jgi:hypothetical protein
VFVKKPKIGLSLKYFYNKIKMTSTESAFTENINSYESNSTITQNSNENKSQFTSEFGSEQHPNILWNLNQNLEIK